MKLVSKLKTVAYVFAALAVCPLAAVIWYLFLRLFSLVKATTFDDALTAVLDWALHLVL